MLSYWIEFPKYVHQREGYTRYIEYDDQLRTTKECDNQAQCGTVEYHAEKDLVLSSTDALGMKSTTIYDDEDRPVDTYGPAPSAWFDTDRTPLTAYEDQIPHSGSSYDEGIVGPSVAYYEYEGDINPKGKLFGSPKLHSTGIQDYIHSPTQDGNLIHNSSAELQDPNTGSEPLSWSKSEWGTNTTQFSYENDGHTGSRSVKAEITSYTDGDAKWFFDPIEVQAGKTYTYKHYYKSDAYSDVVAQFIDKDGNSSYQWQSSLSPTSTWQQYTKSIVIPTTAVKMTVLHVFNSTGWLQMDDVELTTTPGNAGSLDKSWSTAPIGVDTDREGWGVSMTGMLRLPSSGGYQVKASHDDGVKVWIDIN